MLVDVAPSQEAVLANVVLQAPEAPVAETNNWLGATQFTLHLVRSPLRYKQPVQHRQPNDELWLRFQPTQKVRQINAVRVVGVEFGHCKTISNAIFYDLRATKRIALA